MSEQEFRTIYAHELRPGDMIQTFDDIMYVLKCTPDVMAPTRLRVIRMYSSREDKTFDYDDMSGPNHRAGKFPMAHGRFLFRLPVQSLDVAV